jgi:hypothetical protein
MVYLNNTTLNAVFDNKLDGLDGAMLTKSMNTVHCLCVASLATPRYDASQVTHDTQRQGSTSCP